MDRRSSASSASEHLSCHSQKVVVVQATRLMHGMHQHNMHNMPCIASSAEHLSCHSQKVVVQAAHLMHGMLPHQHCIQLFTQIASPPPLVLVIGRF